MSNIDVWSGLMLVSASNMMLWHHFHSTSDPDLPNLMGPSCLVLGYKGASILPWDSIPMAQTLCICLIWMYEVIWGGYQPQTWRYGIIFTPQVTLSSQIGWSQLGPCHCIRVPRYSLETAYQWLKRFVCVCYGYMSLKHDVMALFSHTSDPHFPNLMGPTWPVLG
jgi:hypothetical protein